MAERVLGARFSTGDAPMHSQFSRSQLLFGEDGMEKLFRARVAVFGVGGVGGYAVEALARSGVGTLDLFDNDKVCLTNLNRQIIATHKTIGRYKVDAARDRIADINPAAVVNAFPIFFTPETSGEVDFSVYDYVVDAIDTVTGKIEIVVRCKQAGVRVISCMGAGNKLNAAALEVADIYKTSVCPLAKVIRKELRLRRIDNLKVVYSTELPLKPALSGEETKTPRRQIPGSTAYVPATAGLMLAGEVVNDLTGVVQPDANGGGYGR